jgi:hypothetical protein
VQQQYWVIGGEYRDGDFREMNCDDGRVYGPFGSYEQAQEVWRERSTETRPIALMRYSIVTDARSQTAAA